MVGAYHVLLIHSSVAGCRRGLLVLAVVHNAAVDTGVQVDRILLHGGRNTGHVTVDLAFFSFILNCATAREGLPNVGSKVCIAFHRLAIVITLR